MRLRMLHGGAHLLTAGVCLAALVHRLFWGLGSQTIAGRNFFAYLTIQSNTALLVLCIVGGIVTLRTAEDPDWLTTARALVLSWTTTAGLAFALIVWQADLRGIPITVPWSDIVLHFVLPVWTLLMWTVGPGRSAASFRVVPWVVVYPVVWGVLTMARGAQVGWYPYYFLDLRQVSGIGEWAITCAVALGIFAAIACGIVALSRWRTTVPGSD